MTKRCNNVTNQRLPLFHSELRRFERKIERVPFCTCWFWVGALGARGYGATAGYEQLAHRASWRFHFGPIPKGMQVLHRCDIPSCVNPLHLFLGTQADNMRDKVSKGRQARGPTHAAAIMNGRGAHA